MKLLTIIKLGGSLVKDLQSQNKLIKELVVLSQKQNIILVHGGGHEINILLKKFKIKNKFINGLRFTDKKTLSIVEMVLSGKVNKILVTELIKNGAQAVGISGKDAKSVICKQIRRFGFVGEPIKINKKLIKILTDNNFLPVIAPMGLDVKNNVMNINADTLAAAIAIAFKANKLIFLTDVLGVFDKNKNMIKNIKVKDMNTLIKNGVITGGMIPKLYSCINAVKKGVKEVWISNKINGMQKSKGTLIKK
ncbi:MAG: acetylglutamate kinase [Endomicrobium sp.]|jgi:acetylglutamate kinase|nr:acetylglutamate kinase [Endomicrobium sp.]